MKSPVIFWKNRTILALAVLANAIALNFAATSCVKAQAMPGAPDSKVAVIKLILSVQNGEVKQMTLHSVKVINSIGPERPSPREGEWLVELKGADGVSFSINNPVTEMKLDNNGQHPDKDGNPHKPVEGQFNWTLFIPLYYKNEPLFVREIIITDKATNRPLVKAILPPQTSTKNKPVS